MEAIVYMKILFDLLCFIWLVKFCKATDHLDDVITDATDF